MNLIKTDQRVVIGMMDGFGMEYYHATPLPNIKGRLAKEGLFKQVTGVYPSVTNVNNVSIACGTWPKRHGITANSYFDQASGNACYMNAAELIRSETIFHRAARIGIKSAILSAKRKSLELFAQDTDIAIAAEEAPPALVQRFGEPGDIYSREINYWLWRVAVDLLKTRPDIGLIYVHITDYPMHTWAPEEEQSQVHLATLDSLIGEAVDSAPDAAFLLTADHGMNRKERCWDLTRVCRDAGTPIRFALSPERDYYIKHHRNFTGCAWVWLNDQSDFDSVSQTIRKLQGVEEILDRDTAAQRYHTLPEHLGDLIVNADQSTMFGDMDVSYQELPRSYRAHGSLHEMVLPLIIYNASGFTPSRNEIQANKDLTRFLWI
jgi:phosphonoacetate hydrolase